MLSRLAEASLDHPTGVVHEVIFPVVSEATLRDLVKEWKATGPFYRAHVQTVMRSAYRSHYRRMLPPLLEALEFRSHHATHQPLIQALPLTQLNEALRAVMLEGKSLADDGVAWRVAALAAWGGASFLLALRWFRWQ